MPAFKMDVKPNIMMMMMMTMTMTMTMMMMMLKLVNYVSVQHAAASGHKCKYVKTFDLHSHKHSMKKHSLNIFDYLDRKFWHVCIVAFVTWRCCMLHRDVYQYIYSYKILLFPHFSFFFKVYDTKCSKAVTHPSTNFARQGLTSVIRREPVLSL